MKEYFAFLLFFLMLCGFFTVSCGNDPRPDPCETDPQPGCPNYVDPCDSSQPGCPDYVDPEPVLESNITIGTSNYTVDEIFL